MTVKRPIRVLLVNHHPIIRAHIRQVLERESQVLVIAEAADGREAILLSQHKNPDLVLLDFQLPHLSGIRVARKIADQANTLSLFISALSDYEYVLEALKAGARGFVLSESVPSDLPAAIFAVTGGGIFLSAPITSELVDECNRRMIGSQTAVTSYHKQLICWLAQGISQDDIARRLQTTVASVQMAREDAKTRLQSAGLPETIVSLV